jgi:hypothetical protein
MSSFPAVQLVLILALAVSPRAESLQIVELQGGAVLIASKVEFLGELAVITDTSGTCLSIRKNMVTAVTQSQPAVLQKNEGAVIPVPPRERRALSVPEASALYGVEKAGFNVLERDGNSGSPPPERRGPEKPDRKPGTPAPATAGDGPSPRETLKALEKEREHLLEEKRLTLLGHPVIDVSDMGDHTVLKPESAAARRRKVQEFDRKIRMVEAQIRHLLRKQADGKAGTDPKRRVGRGSKR